MIIGIHPSPRKVLQNQQTYELWGLDLVFGVTVSWSNAYLSYQLRSLTYTMLSMSTTDSDGLYYQRKDRHREIHIFSSSHSRILSLI
jgi:hypothetical protein